MALINSKADGAKIVKRYDEGKKQRSLFDTRVDLLAPYIEPTRGSVHSDRTLSPGYSIMSRMYDSEGISAADMAVRQTGSYLHGPGSQWFGVEDERDEINDDDEAREWFEECRDRMLKDMAHGGFYSESYESDMDWMGFGTGHMRVEQRPVVPYQENLGYRGARFVSHKVGRFVVFENGAGEVDETYVELRKSAKAAVDLFGKENLPEQIIKALEAGRADEFRFIHGVYPRPDSEKTYGNKKMPFASCYVHYESKTVVKESGYERFPDVAPRWTRCFGEAYGRGLGEIALNNLITLNTAMRMTFNGWGLSINPVLVQRHNGVVGTLRLKPWGLVTVRTQGSQSVGDVLQPLKTSGQPEVSQLNAEQLRKSIREIFHADMLQQLMQLEGQAEMRVYVFKQKQNIVQRLLGPTYGRWENEFGIPLIGNHFNLMYQNGAFSSPPDIILQNGGRIRVRFESPLAQAQRMGEVEALNSAMGELMPIVQLQLNQWKMTGKQPDDWILDTYNFDKFAETINRRHGVPATVTNSDKQIALIRQSRGEAEAKQAANKEAMMAAEGAGKAAPMLRALQGGKAA